MKPLEVGYSAGADRLKTDSGGGDRARRLGSAYAMFFSDVLRDPVLWDECGAVDY